jgi:hypothetical protein
MSLIARRRLAILTGIMWASAISILVPLPNRSIEAFEKSYDENLAAIENLKKSLGDTKEQGENISTPTPSSVAKGIWIRWLAKFVLVLAGLSVAYMTLNDIAYWRTGIVVSSALYIAGWLLPFHRGPDSWMRNFVNYGRNMIGSESEWIRVAYCLQDIALPLLHVLVLLGVLIALVRQKQVFRKQRRV